MVPRRPLVVELSDDDKMLVWALIFESGHIPIRTLLGNCSRELHRPLRLRLLAWAQRVVFQDRLWLWLWLLLVSVAEAGGCCCCCGHVAVAVAGGHVAVAVAVSVSVRVCVSPCLVCLCLMCLVCAVCVSCVCVWAWACVFVCVCVWWWWAKSGETLVEASRDTNAQIVRYTFFMGAKDNSNHLTAGSSNVSPG